MSPETISWIVLAAFFAVGAFVWWYTAGKVTPQQLAQGAQMAVMAAEQYRSTGQLATNDSQLKFAIDFVKRLIPAAKRIDERLIIDAIHSFVPAANAITAQIEAARVPVNANPQPVPHVPPTSAPDKPLVLGR